MTALAPGCHRWEPARQELVPEPGLPTEPALLAADSFYVADGRVRGLGRHWQRFAAAVEAAGAPCAQLGPFRSAVDAALPRQGDWFPRVELVRPEGAAVLRVRIRAAPPRTERAAVWVVPEHDSRTVPRIKGPDLGHCAGLRSRAAAVGADEALLTDREGRLLEGAYSSLLWWEEGRLWAVPDEAPILAGVTRDLLLMIAARDGVGVGYRRPRPADLVGREVWLANALHGIRTVTAWRGGNGGVSLGPDPPPPAQAARWRRRLAALAEPLDRPGAGPGTPP